MDAEVCATDNFHRRGRYSNYQIDDVQRLQEPADIAASLEIACDHVLQNRFPAGNDVFEETLEWREYVKEHGLTRDFILPTFEKLEMELELHKAWVKDIPWYLAEYLGAVYEDILRYTGPKDDLPPENDGFHTCICTSPVLPPPTGVVSDAVQCDHCFARFHGECAKDVESCLFCDQNHWNRTIHRYYGSFHFCSLKTILENVPEISKNYSEIYFQLDIIVRRIDRLASVIEKFLSDPEPKHLHEARHYMRKLYKIPFAISKNPGTSLGLDLANLYGSIARRQLLAIRLTFGPDIDNNWTDGTRCICRGQSAGLRGYPTVECEHCGRLYHIV